MPVSAVEMASTVRGEVVWCGVSVFGVVGGSRNVGVGGIKAAPCCAVVAQSCRCVYFGMSFGFEFPLSSTELFLWV